MNEDSIPVMVGEAARAARTSDDTIRRAFDTGQLAGVRTEGGIRLIDRGSLAAYTQARDEQRKARGRPRAS